MPKQSDSKTEQACINVPQMEENIALAVGIAPSRVNVKATTEERLGFTGTGEGMACHAVCLLDE